MSNTAQNPKSVVVVIDLAKDFVFAGGTIADAGGAEYQDRAQTVIPNIARLLSAARDSGVLVVYATDAHTEADYELHKWPPHSMKGTDLAEIVPDLAPEPGDLVIEKQTYSPFVSSDIDDQLRAGGIEQLYITGLHTDCCARHTSGDAFQRGYDLVWVTDTMQAFTQEAHEQGLDYLEAWYASEPERQFKTVDEVVTEWADAARPAVTA